jgi:hypothetical protein
VDQAVDPVRSPDPCAPSEPTDQWIAGPGLSSPGGGRIRGRTLPTGIRVSAELIFNFAELSQGAIPDPPVTDRLVSRRRGSSYKGHGVDALAPGADEGRGRLRKASGSREQALIRRCPNGETRPG